MNADFPPFWLTVSLGLTAITWLYMLRTLRTQKISVSSWDQWANLGRFIRFVREEGNAEAKRKHMIVLGVHALATASALCAFVFWVKEETG